MKFLLLIGLFVGPIAFAAKFPVYLYDIRTKKYSAVHVGPLLPNRVYVRRADSINRLVYGVTDEEGKLPNPLTAYMAGSVIPGSFLGGSAKQKFEFTEKGTWVVTKAPLQNRFWVSEGKPEYLIETFGTR